MRYARYKPNLITYNCMMKACSSAPERIRSLIQEMKMLGLVPDMKSWSILLDACGTNSEFIYQKLTLHQSGNHRFNLFQAFCCQPLQIPPLLQRPLLPQVLQLLKWRNYNKQTVKVVRLTNEINNKTRVDPITIKPHWHVQAGSDYTIQYLQRYSPPCYSMSVPRQIPPSRKTGTRPATAFTTCLL